MFYSVSVGFLRGNVLPSTTGCIVVLHAVTLEIILKIAAYIVIIIIIIIIIIIVVIVISRVTICV